MWSFNLLSMDTSSASEIAKTPCSSPCPLIAGHPNLSLFNHTSVVFGGHGIVMSQQDGGMSGHFWAWGRCEGRDCLLSNHLASAQHSETKNVLRS